MEITRDIIQLIFTPIMLVIILGYQYFKIRNLKDQLAGQDKILTSVKTYFDILSPEMLKYRVELYEKTVEKQMKIDLEKMESKLAKRTDTMKTTQSAFIKMINSATRAIADSFVFIPDSHRVRIVNAMTDDILREILEANLPKYREFDAKIKNATMGYLLGGGKL